MKRLLFTLCYFLYFLSYAQSPLKAKEITPRINYLKRIINQPLNDDSDIIHLAQENPEFMLFSYAFSTYAFTNLAISDSIYKEEAIILIKESIIKVLHPRISSPYEIYHFINEDIDHYSILYLGHLNLMMGCYRLLSNDTTFNKLNNQISLSLFNRYQNTFFLNLESYSFAIWIPDNTVAIASLKLHSINTNSQYDHVCNEWVKYVKTHYIEPNTKVLYSTISPEIGKYMEEPRGSMLGWSIMFIYRFDPKFAIELYQNYKNHFSKNFLIFRLFKERYKNNKTKIGDIDSGPIFRGYSIPANEFALSGAILSKDWKTAKKIERLINWGTKKVKKNNELYYKVKFINMNISPMAEALVLNSLTMTKWFDN